MHRWVGRLLVYSNQSVWGIPVWSFQQCGESLCKVLASEDPFQIIREWGRSLCQALISEGLCVTTGLFFLITEPYLVSTVIIDLEKQTNWFFAIWTTSWKVFDILKMFLNVSNVFFNLVNIQRNKISLIPCFLTFSCHVSINMTLFL